jgi:hypothetical protein
MKIKEVKDTGRTFGDEKKPIFDVWCEGDNKKYACFNPDILKKIGQEVEATVTEKEYKGQKEYTLSLKKEGFGGKPFAKSNADKQKALECAVKWLNEKPEAKKEHVIILAEFFLEWLKK